MPYQNLVVQTDGPILRITINRPGKLNALNQKTVSELDSAFSKEALSEDVRVVVLTGAGDKAFVAGADIGEIEFLGET